MNMNLNDLLSLVEDANACYVSHERAVMRGRAMDRGLYITAWVVSSIKEDQGRTFSGVLDSWLCALDAQPPAVDVERCDSCGALGAARPDERGDWYWQCSQCDAVEPCEPPTFA